MRERLVLFLMLLMAVAVPARSQQEKGDSELQLQGSLSLGTGGAADNYGSFQAIYGWFFTGNQEAGLGLTGFFDDEGDIAGRGGPFYRYNFLREDIVPYVGAELAAGFGNSSFGDNALLTLEAGARFFLNRSTAFTVEANTIYLIDEQEVREGLDILFGFSYLWNK